VSSSPDLRAGSAWSVAWPAAVSGVAFGVYVLTLLRGVAFADPGEMQTVPYVLGIAHPTGYPTYTLLAAVVDRFPLGTVAVRANLLSAVCVALALGVTVVILVRLGARPVIAAATALALGVLPTVWAAALVAEVNPLHLLLVALLIHRALCWHDRRGARDLVIGGALIGLAFGNHLLTVTVAPFLVAFVLWTGRAAIRRRPAVLVPAVGATLAALLVYLYLPLRAAQHPPLAYDHPETLDRFLDLVLGRQFSGQFAFLTPAGPSNLVRSLGDLWGHATGGEVVVAVLGLVGLVVLIARRRAFGLAIAPILVAGVYVFANYGELEHYLLVPYLVLAIGAGVTLDVALAFGPRAVLGGRLRRPLAAGVLAVSLALPVGMAGVAWRSVDRSGDSVAAAYVDQVFALLPPDAALLSYWRATTPLWYGQHVDGRRPDVLIVDDSNVVYDGYGTREDAVAKLVCSRRVFIIRPGDGDLAPLRARFRLQTVGTVRVEVPAEGIVERPIDEVTAAQPVCA
jgi:hypothetical protein